MNKLVSALTLLLFFVVFLTFGQSLDKNQKLFTTEDGISGKYIYALLQDKNGFIWAGTSIGLNKYDGYSFTSYKNRPGDSLSLSNNSINDLAEDKDGNIWIATEGGGVSKFNTRLENFRQYLQKETDSTLISDNYITSLFIDSKNRVWAGHWEGLDLYNPEKDRFERVLGPSDKFTYYHTYWILDITEDDNNNLWLGTEASGAVYFNTTTKKIEKYYTLQEAEIGVRNNSLTSIRTVAFNDGVLWFSGVRGIAYINPLKDKEPTLFIDGSKDYIKDKNTEYQLFKTKSGRIFYHERVSGNLKEIKKKTDNIFLPEQFQYLNPSLGLYSLLEDDTGSLWLGSTDIIYQGAKVNPFRHYTNFKEKASSSKDSEYKYFELFEDSKGRIWFEDLHEGLMWINERDGTRKKYPEVSSEFIKNDYGYALNDIKEDHHGNIWLFLYSKIINLNPDTGKFRTLSPFFVYYEDKSALMINYSGAAFDEDGVLFIPVSLGSFMGIDPDNFIYTHRLSYIDSKVLDPKLMPGYPEIVFVDKNGAILVGFDGEGLYNFNKEKSIFSKIDYQVPGINDTNANKVKCLYQKNKEILWIGTASGFFKFNTKTKKSIQYGVNGEMPSPYINDILDDGYGNLWLTTNKGITKFTPEAETFQNYDIKDGLGQNDFNDNSSFKSSFSNFIYLAGEKGVTVFDVTTIKSNSYIPKIAFTSFKKHNAKGEFTQIAGVNYKKNLKLSYNDRDFTIEITALDYTNPSKNEYAYWLEGYNTNWVEIGTRREITFTNLSPGSYNLRVKGANNDGVWNEQGRSLLITILPPWWGTWWAYTFYALLLLALLYAAYQYRINQLEAIRFKELDEAKRTMYTNITHEFRTPLTVISGISKELRERSTEQDKEYLDLIDRSSKNMLYLVNQLLELRKLEIGKTQFDYIQGDIIAYLKYLVESFKTYAKTKDISLHFVSIADEIYMDYDPDKLLMILSNLLSNAIKYSKPGGDVYLQVEELENKLQIKVVDSGKGIHEQELPHIFDRFYKVQHKEDDNIDGVGIGLAVTKELTELLKGEIYANSQIGQGSIFTLELPIENKAPMSKSATKIFEKPANTRKASVTPKALWSKTQTKKEALQLLIIEDNTAIVQYLRSCLKEHWNLAFAADGLKGIEKAIEEVPDIILCDLMMPNANGYKVLEVLKNDSSTSHIPIVILTAKADEESRLEAYKKGADAYLLKPFNKEELQIILQKLTEQRRLLQERYKTQASLRFADGVEIHKEDAFIQKLEELVLSEDSKSSYSIKSLCEDLGMSRTQLHNKIKALTGKSTSIFVRSLRLQKGKYLLEHTGKAISEIAYDVGFNNPSYFTKSFTEEFGIPPSSLRKV